jgi:hypothetical protein
VTGLRSATGWLIAFGAGFALAWWLGTRTDRSAPAVPPAISSRSAAAPALARADNADPERQLPAQRDRAASDLGAIAQLDSEFEQNLALLRLIENDDAAALLARLEDAARSLGGSDYVAATSMVLTRLTELDPQAALDYALRTPGFAQRSWLSAIFFAWARSDFAASQAAFRNLPAMARTIAAQAILRAREDLGQAAREALATELGLPAVPLTPTATFEEAWAQAQRGGNDRVRMNQLQQVLQAWTATDPQAAWDAVQAIDNRQLRQGMTYQAMYFWAQNDPQGAIDAIAGNTRVDDRNQMLMEAMKVLGERDLGAALDRVSLLPEGLQQSGRLALVAQVAAQDPSLLDEWLSDSDSNRFKRQAYQQLLGPLLAGNDDASLDWIDRLPEADAREAENLAITYLSSSDPERAVARIDNLPPGSARNNATVNLVGNWASSDPRAAAAWFDTLPAEQRDRTLPNLISNWAGQDYEGAAAYLDRMPRGEPRQSARALLIGRARDADRIDEIMADISAPSVRQNAVVLAYRQLLRVAPDRARRYEAEAQAAEEALRVRRRTRR